MPLVAGRSPMPEVAGAGRTDAGVHALAQVASVNVEFALDAASVGRALNDRLARDIRVVESVEAAPGFHARFDAVGKSYRYRMAIAPVVPPFDRWFVWHAPGPRDVDAMRRAAAVLSGRHDFASFQARGTSTSDTVRTIARLEIIEADGELVIEVAGDGFLRHMVRAIVGTLADIGAGTRPAGAMASILEARDRRAAGPTVPASGLVLTGVRYEATSTTHASPSAAATVGETRVSAPGPSQKAGR